MDGLVQFLRDRLDEDANTAQASDQVDPGPWSADAHDEGGNNAHQHRTGYGVVASPGGDLWKCTSSAAAMAANTSRHIARHDPARILAEVEAKRALVAKYIEVADNDINEVEYAYGYANALGEAVRLLALPYASHPDYSEAWRP